MTRPGKGREGAGSTRRLFTIYALVSLVPVVVLGVVLLRLLAIQTDRQGLAEGTKGASLIARTALAPVLSGNDLRAGVNPLEKALLDRSVTRVLQNGQVTRLRIRDLDGKVVYTYGSQGAGAAEDDEAIEAARGETIARLTYLNADADANDSDINGAPVDRGPRVIEVYEPLNSAQNGTRIGVVELYLPYAPIAADISSGRETITIALSLGLLGVWACLLAVSVSVTRRLRREARINAVLANNDVLTGLPNRSRFIELVRERTQGVTATRQAAVVVVDIDRFKEINDTLGHDNGDRLIQTLAKRISGQLRDSDIVARIGGDEFGIVLDDVVGGRQAVDDVMEVLTRLRKALAEPLRIDELPLAVEASVGYAIAPRDGDAAGLLLQRADMAMYVAKQQHLGVAGYTSDQDHYDSAALQLVAELGEAIQAGQLVLHYQPKLDLDSNEITSIEALVRWNHPARGLLYPDAFLPAAEQTELIEPLTWWVLRNATLDLAELDPHGRLRVAVNISARSLTRADFADDLLAVLAGTGTSPDRVTLEVTETLLLTDPPRAAATLRRLHDAGFEVSIDDFGAGQTSLGYLAMLPISELKIDKSFVMPMLTNERKASIVRSVIELGHSLGLTVTAEGVESADVLARLRAYSCDTVQGYLISTPISLERLREYLALGRQSKSVGRLRSR